MGKTQEDVHIQVLASGRERYRTVLVVDSTVNMVFEAVNMGVVDRIQDSDEDLASDC